MARANLIIAVFVIAAVASCTLPTEIALYNNTAADVTLILDGGMQQLGKGAIAELEEMQLDQLTLVIDGQALSYQRPLLIPEAFVLWRGWGPWTKRSLRFQVESDGKIWVVGPDQVVPVDTFVAQPEGYPLEPSAV